MASTYSNLKIQLMTTGENSTTWGDVTNLNLGTALEEAIVGSADVTFASGNVTLTLTDSNSSQTARNMRLRCTGTTGGSTRNLVVPSIEKPYIVQNDCADSIVIKTSAGSGVTVPAGKTLWVYNNGTDVVAATDYLTSLALGTALPVTSGGTGANTFTNNALLKGSGTSALTPSIVYENGGYVGINVSGPANLLDAQETLNGSGGISYVNLSTGASSAGSITVEAGGSYFYHKVTRATGVVQFRGVTSTTLNQDFNTQVFRSTGGTEYARFDGSGLTLVTALPVTSGGTGGTTQSTARSGIGATTLGGNLFTITNPSAVTFPRFNADNTVSALDAATFRSAIGAGTSSTTGTVTSVAGTGTVNGLTLTGTVTSSGNITLGGTLSGIANSALTNSSITINGSAISLGGSVSVGTVTSVAGTGTVNGLTLTGTVTSTGSLTLGGTLSGVSLTTQVTGTLPIANGGTGATDAATALTNLGAYAATNPAGYTTNTGTVTSVGGTGSANGLSLSGTVTTSGNITLSGSVTSVATGATIDGVTIGYRNIPRSTTSGTATTADVGKVIAVSAGITIPNSTFAAGDAVSIYNDSASSITITAGVTTLRQAGTTNTGNRTLAARGMATVWFNSATEAVISGAGVS